MPVQVAAAVHTARAEKIRGWMSVSELQWLASMAAASTVVVEVGTFVGRSARATWALAASSAPAASAASCT